MEETILTLAQAISGAGEKETALLTALCIAAAERWTGRLREGVTAADCGEAFRCAAAFTAVADLAAGGNGGSVASFTAGEVSVRGRAAAETAALSRALRQTAEGLMAPYAVAADFAFRGVRG